jgi:hypothetical protein
MRMSKYLPVVFIYFFINSLGLPFGLTYTALLSPLLYVWVVISRRQEVLWPFLLALTPVVLIQLSLGVDTKSYFISLLNITLVYLFCQAAYMFFIKCQHPEEIFHQLLIINFVCCIIAIPLFFTPYSDLLWTKQFITTGAEEVTRLSLLTYEPSYYALLFTPLFCYFLLQLIFYRNSINGWLLLVMLLLPLVLSFSLGVISAIAVALVISFVVHFKTFIRNKRFVNLAGVAVVSVVTALLIGLIFFPDNIFFVRIGNVLSGKDSSGKGRTFEAFWLAGELLAKKSYWWGIGAGQIKILGFELIRDFYGYSYDTVRVAIPNAAAETLALFGWVGFVVRILTECVLFIYTKVWRNYYRLLLFTFIFVYQFTGSFITNVAEYVIWIIVFANVFKEYDVIKKSVQC